MLRLKGWSGSTRIGNPMTQKIKVGRVDVEMEYVEHGLRLRDGDTRVVEYTVIRGATCNLKIQSTTPDLKVNAFNKSVSWGGITRSVEASFKYDCQTHVLNCEDRTGDAYAHWIITPHKKGCKCKRP